MSTDLVVQLRFMAKEFFAEIQGSSSLDWPMHPCWQAAAEIERLKAALRPLLEHYLDCYDGHEDQLAKDARAALEEKP